tara:strand:+ start:3847 stop:5343 length:1497 start_codon:yes stop_codon:yes gene_type:complete
MAFWDRFTKQKKKSKRHFTGTNGGRLFNDWKASSSSPDAELINLGTMRDRTRDLARNNPIVQRYFQVIKQGVIGNQQGFKLMVHSRDSDGTLDDFANDLIEYRWYNDFCTNPEVSGKYTMLDIYNMVLEGLIRDGEVFVQLIRQRDGLKLKFLEPDYLDARLSKDLSGNRQIKMGVEVDSLTDKPLGYWLTDNPYALSVPDTQLTKSTRLPADDVLHIFQPQRFGQTRGYPYKLASTMTAIKWLQDFRLSELVASKAAASKMAFIRTPTGEDNVAESYLDEDGYMPAMNFEPATIDVLPHGTDIEFANWNHPNTSVESFDKAMIRTIASGLGVSYASLSNDLTQTSYSSARVGLLDERDGFKQLQTFIINHFAKPVYHAWLEQEMTTGNINLPIDKYEKFANPCEFSSRGYHSVDPLKEMQSNQLGLSNGLLTIQDVLNQSGKELSQHFSELDAQQALADKFNIELAYEPYGTKFNQQTGEPFNEDENQEPSQENNNE